MRLNKYISESGICSRREADRFIEQGHVFTSTASGLESRIRCLPGIWSRSTVR